MAVAGASGSPSISRRHALRKARFLRHWRAAIGDIVDDAAEGVDGMDRAAGARRAGAAMPMRKEEPEAATIRRVMAGAGSRSRHGRRARAVVVATRKSGLPRATRVTTGSPRRSLAASRAASRERHRALRREPAAAHQAGEKAGFVDEPVDAIERGIDHGRGAFRHWRDRRR